MVLLLVDDFEYSSQGVSEKGLELFDNGFLFFDGLAHSGDFHLLLDVLLLEFEVCFNNVDLFFLEHIDDSS